MRTEAGFALSSRPCGPIRASADRVLMMELRHPLASQRKSLHNVPLTGQAHSGLVAGAAPSSCKQG